MICLIGWMKSRMAREEHTTKCSSTSSCVGGGGGHGWRDGGGGGGGGGGSSSKRPSKKLKQKKIPQRGLGVAQLEKLRQEEQQKKEAALQAEPSVGIFSPNNKIYVTLDDSSSNLPDQCQNTNLPLDNLWQRSLQSCSSSMMEPPSNQSYYGNNYTPCWPEEEKTAVLKRQYPFPSEIPTSSSFHSRLPFTFVSQSISSGEPASLPEDLQGTKSTNTIIRGSSSSGRTITGKDSLDYDYGFLTLAPPATTHANQELPRTTEVCKRSESTSGSYEQQPFFCFLPTPNLENSQSEVEVVQTVDLNLKL